MGQHGGSQWQPMAASGGRGAKAARLVVEAAARRQRRHRRLALPPLLAPQKAPLLPPPLYCLPLLGCPLALPPCPRLHSKERGSASYSAASLQRLHALFINQVAGSSGHGQRVLQQARQAMHALAPPPGAAPSLSVTSEGGGSSESLASPPAPLPTSASGAAACSPVLSSMLGPCSSSPSLPSSSGGGASLSASLPATGCPRRPSASADTGRHTGN